MSSKLRIRLGTLEVDYEGTDDFISNGLIPLIESLVDVDSIASKLGGTSGHANGSGVSSGSMGNGGHSGNGVANGDEAVAAVSRVSSELTTSTIAQRLAVSSGPELVVAAVARITLALGKPRASRKDLLEEMKLATEYFRDSYSKNLTNSLQNLVTSGKLNNLGGSNYALSAAHREEVEKALAK